MKKNVWILSFLACFVFITGCKSKVAEDLLAGYTVSFDANGGEGKMDSINLSDLKDGYLPSSEFINEGFDFIGWSLSEDGVVIYSDKDKIPLEQKNIILYAIWKEIHQHSFSEEWFFDSNSHWHAAICNDTNERKNVANHSLTDWKEEVAPTEASTGLNEKHCTVCNFSMNQIIPRLVHTHKLGTKHEAVAATCLTTGNIEYYECEKSSCDKLLDKDLNVLDSVEVSSTGHKADDGMVTSQPTCGAKGIKITKCTQCSVVLIIEDIPETGSHIENEGSITKEPSCAENGIKSFACTKCNKVVRTESIPSLAHIKDSGTIVPSTCTTSGLILYKCTLCSETLSAIPIAATGHTEDEGTITKEPVCVVKGVKTYRCSVCHADLRTEDVPVTNIHIFSDGYCKNCSCKEPGTLVNESWMSSVGNLIINGSEIAKTSEVVVIPTGTIATIEMEDDSAWSNYTNESTAYTGVFLKGRKIKLSPFVMSQYEVTRDLYKAVIGNAPSTTSFAGTEGENPVNTVNWYDAIIFCNKLSMLYGLECVYSYDFSEDGSGVMTNPDDWFSDTENLSSTVPINDASTNYKTWRDCVKIDISKNGYRLPTETEWEFAARGGDPTKEDWKFAFSGIDVTSGNKLYIPGSNFTDPSYLCYDANLSKVAWWGANSSESTHPVGTKNSNRLNLFDMSGNVYEWCEDFQTNIIIDNDVTEKNPIFLDSGPSSRVLRGGGFHNTGRGSGVYNGQYATYHGDYNASKYAVSTRGSFTPSKRDKEYGFRLVRSISR